MISPAILWCPFVEPPPVGDDTPWLPWNRPSVQTLRDHQDDFIWFAHDHKFKISMDNVNTSNANEYYNKCLNPTANFWTNNIGGSMRQRPFPRPPKTGNYELKDLTNDCCYMIDVGIDICFSNSGGTATGDNSREEFRDIKLEAARLANIARGSSDGTGFGYCINWDAAGNTLPQNVTPQQAADFMTANMVHPGWARVNGRPIWGAYKPEQNAASIQWYKDVATLLGTTAWWIPTFLNVDGGWNAFSNHATTVDNMVAYSPWGTGRAANAVAGVGALKTTADNRGKIFLWPWRNANTRYKAGWGDATNIPDLLIRHGREMVTRNAKAGQNITWNDFGENSEVRPATKHGYTILHICAYFAHRLKMGSYPTIQRDAIYLCHYKHNWSLQPNILDPLTSGGSGVMAVDAGGQGTPDNLIRAVFWTTAGATLRIYIATAATGGTETQIASTTTTDNGMTVVTAPMQAGYPRARMIRNNDPVVSVNSDDPIVTSTDYQDWQIRCYSSIPDSLQPALPS